MVNKLRKNVFKAGTILAMAALLLIMVAVPSLAQTPTPTPTPKLRLPPAALHSAQGKVSSLTADNIVLQDGTQAAITITVGANTKYYLVSLGRVAGFFSSVLPSLGQDKNLPSLGAAMKDFRIPSNWKADFSWLDKFNGQAKLSDVAVGDRIMAQLAADSNLAKQVLIIKTPVPVILQVKGTVSGLGTNSFTIHPVSGADVDLKWDANTRFTLKGLIAVQAGQYAVATYNRNTMVAQIVSVEATIPTPLATSNRSNTPANH